MQSLLSNRKADLTSLRYPEEDLTKQAILRLLEVKDSDIRLMNLYQCRHAVDRAIHIGGASSATIPMTCLYYGGFVNIDIEQPTDPDQDIFVLSKGHAVATLASIYSDIGYIDKSVLKHSRSVTSILNGHPGPLLPGVHVATGPMGQGFGVAQGFAIIGQREPRFDVFALTGDGELQEGPIWEAVMFAGYKRLENLCVMVDYNGGQLDITDRLHFPYRNLDSSFTSFGWRVVTVDATQYHMLYDALSDFKYGKRDGRPTAIICDTTKGHGGFSNFMNKHKTSIEEPLLNQEQNQQERARALRVAGFCKFFNSISAEDRLLDDIQEIALKMGFEIKIENNLAIDIDRLPPTLKTRKAPVRNKKISYKEQDLPKLQKGVDYTASQVIEDAMKVLASDQRVASIDSDLASTSGLQAGVGFVDKYRALNVGVAEANMMLIGEAFAVLGLNVWISTFCPFYDWKILRRIAVGHQERLEDIAKDDGWLSEGHGLDYTMIATAADFETQANGATHMGNDDALLFNEAAHIKIINIACPQMLLNAIKWIAEGNKGIVYMRTLRAAASVIYDEKDEFEFGKAYSLQNLSNPDAFIVSTCRMVHESLAVSQILAKEGTSLEVIDMPSIDKNKILEIYRSGKPIFIAEQNNGYLWSNFRKVLFDHEKNINTENLIPINAASEKGIHYIHSGTYKELAAHYKLDSKNLSLFISDHLKNKRS
jgi:transketolase